MDSTARTVFDQLIVGKEFVKQYYHILYNMPEHLHRFYQETSKVGRVGQDGVMQDFSTLQGITEALKALSYGDFKSAEITSYDTQVSHSGGFLLVATGYFTLNERLRSKFTQTFFLAPQEKGYFVLNDILRFVSDPEAIGAEVFSGKVSETPCPINDNKGSEQAACISVNPDGKKASKPLNNEKASLAKVDVLVPEIIDEEVSEVVITRKEVADNLVKNYDPDDGLEGVPKKSYASVLKVTNDKSGDSAGYALSPKKKEHQASSAPLEHILQEQGQQVSSDPSQVVESKAVPKTIDVAENGQNQEFEGLAEGTSVHVKHLPRNATIDMLETEFKQFGAITNGGIQVIIQKGYVGFPYGFVEFEEADAAQRAIEASPITIGGQRAFVEEKRSTLKGNRGNGNGYGYRNGVRGRRNYGYGSKYRRGGSFNRRGNEFVASINTY